jgi:endoglucanase
MTQFNIKWRVAPVPSQHPQMQPDVCAGCGALNTGAPSPVGMRDVPAPKPAKHSYVYAQGSQLRTPSGDAITLKGVNLGGWLVTENWMCGITDKSDMASGRFTRETLEDRFGEQKAWQLMELWHKNFITEADFDDIKALGMNTIRVPFGYRTLQDKGRGWQSWDLLDWVIEQAEKRGLYVILDYHSWWGQEKGRSSMDGAAGEEVRRKAYDLVTYGTGDDHEKMLQREHAIRLWTEVLQRYKGVSTIAAVELMNEANGGSMGSAFLYDALRAVDPERLFVIWGHVEGESADWDNVLFGPHIYSAVGPAFSDDQQAIDKEVDEMVSMRMQHSVPCYVGEFHVGGADEAVGLQSVRYLVDRLNAEGLSWTKWTWKGVDNGNWAFVNVDGTKRIDVMHDSFERIKSIWSNLGYGVPNEELRAAFNGAFLSSS